MRQTEPLGSWRRLRQSELGPASCVAVHKQTVSNGFVTRARENVWCVVRLKVEANADGLVACGVCVDAGLVALVSSNQLHTDDVRQLR